MPKEGKPKGGTQASRISASLRQINKEEGLGIEFTGMCDRYPNTEKYHVAMAYVLEAHGAAEQTRCAWRIFKGYFQEGIYPDENNLVQQITEIVHDVDPAALKAELRSDSKLERVVELAQRVADGYGLSDVPYFVFNDKLTASGAQEIDYFLRAFEGVAAS